MEVILLNFELHNGNCIEEMKKMGERCVDFTLTDIPYNAVNRQSNGLRNLDKGAADECTFDLIEFLDEVYRVTRNSICIFCGKEQFSTIYAYFANKKGTVCPIVWEKSNPSPMNGQYIYLSGVEFAVWFKKQGAKVFNARCKNTVFKHPNGRSKIHPTEKNHDLLKELILDNTNPGDIVFDPCMGSATHGKVAIDNGRRFVGIELQKDWFKLACDRINNDVIMPAT